LNAPGLVLDRFAGDAEDVLDDERRHRVGARGGVRQCRRAQPPVRHSMRHEAVFQHREECGLLEQTGPRVDDEQHIVELVDRQGADVLRSIARHRVEVRFEAERRGRPERSQSSLGSMAASVAAGEVMFVSLGHDVNRLRRRSARARSSRRRMTAPVP